MLNTLDERNGKALTRTPTAVDRAHWAAAELIGSGVAFLPETVDGLIIGREDLMKSEGGKVMHAALQDIANGVYDSKTKNNYVVACRSNNGQLSCYALGAEVQYGTDADAVAMLAYVQRQSSSKNWNIAKVGN